MLEPGTPQQIAWSDGNWIFLDIGFSGSQKTCGLVIGDGEPCCVDFPDAQKRILNHLGSARSITNLVIEAPLSVSFRNGRPAPRSIEKRGGQTRFWYVGPGCAVMVASMYLIKAIVAASPPNGVRLVEALVSYKDPGTKSDHMGEAKLLRDAVRYPKHPGFRIVPADELKGSNEDELISAFRVIGLDCGVPAVIVLEPRDCPRSEA
jgi:hypothetical protein